MRTAAILLAAGASRRFGAPDKLLAPFRRRPLVLWSAEALRATAPDMLIAVTGSDRVAALLPGFGIVAVPGPGTAQSDSLRAGVARAAELGADRALICLGDMPLVTADLLGEVLARCTQARGSAVLHGTRPMPPAAFPSALFPALLAVRGDRGARDLIAALPAEALVAAPPEQLADVDTPDDLRALDRSA